RAKLSLQSAGVEHYARPVCPLTRSGHRERAEERQVVVQVAGRYQAEFDQGYRRAPPRQYRSAFSREHSVSHNSVSHTIDLDAVQTYRSAAPLVVSLRHALNACDA